MVKNLLKYHASTKSYVILKFIHAVKFYVHIRPIVSHAGSHIIIANKSCINVMNLILISRTIALPHYQFDYNKLVTKCAPCACVHTHAYIQYIYTRSDNTSHALSFELILSLSSSNILSLYTIALHKLHHVCRKF